MKSLKAGILISLIGAVLTTGCNANLDTRKLSPQIKPPIGKLQGPNTLPSMSPSPTPSASSSVQSPPSPSPSPAGSPVCSAPTTSFSQISGGLLAQWLERNPISEISSTTLTASALVGLRLNQDEGLYFSVVNDSAKNASIGLIRCDSKSPNQPDIMGFAWSNSNLSGIGGGNDPSVTEESSASANCPEETSSALVQNVGKNLPSGVTVLKIVRVRSNAVESLYFLVAQAPNDQLIAGLLHCDEKTPTHLDVLGVATSTSKGVASPGKDPL